MSKVHAAVAEAASEGMRAVIERFNLPEGEALGVFAAAFAGALLDKNKKYDE